MLSKFRHTRSLRRSPKPLRSGIPHLLGEARPRLGLADHRIDQVEPFEKRRQRPTSKKYRNTFPLSFLTHRKSLAVQLATNSRRTYRGQASQLPWMPWGPSIIPLHGIPDPIRIRTRVPTPTSTHRHARCSVTQRQQIRKCPLPLARLSRKRYSCRPHRLEFRTETISSVLQRLSSSNEPVRSSAKKAKTAHRG
jgi:hypothetical protein